jgi:uncharacterized protein
MSAALPEVVDAWRMVSQRRLYEGELALAALPRLSDSLADVEGKVRYRLEFGRDEYGVAFVELRASGELPLICQRTLERFLWPFALKQRLGMITREADEAALPPGYEPLLCPDGAVRPLDVIEDELMLALPLVPMRPGAEGEGTEVPATSLEAKAGTEDGRDNPFAVLQRLKQR